MRKYTKLPLQVISVIFLMLLSLTNTYSQRVTNPLRIIGPCYVLSTSVNNLNYSSSASTQSFTFTTESFCTPDVTDNQTWITLSVNSFTKTVNVSVTANTGAARSGNVYLGEYIVVINQDAVLPATPGTISGITAVCANTSGTYYISAVSGATGYTWLVPSGATITSGQNTTQINVSFGTTSGYVKVRANNSAGSSAYSSKYVTVNPIPVAYSVTGGGSYCIESGALIGLSDSQTGVNYQLKRNGVNVGSVKAGTGSAINFGYQYSAATYTVVATSTSGCTKTMSGFAKVLYVSLPTVYSVTGGSTICSGGTGLPIGLSSSQFGVTYKLYRNSNIFVISKTGTGSSIDFGTQSVAGTYTVVAENSTDCSSLMAGSATVTVYSLPTTYSVTGGGAYCSGDLGVSVSLSNSQVGVSYQLKLNADVNIGLPVTSTGGIISFGNQTTVGIYTVEATNSNGCSKTMSGSATVTVNPLPNLYSITGGGSFCSGGSGVSVGLSDTQSGVIYQLKRNGIDVSGGSISGTGSAISFGNQTIAGTYTVKATNSFDCARTMSGSKTVTVISLPTEYPVTGGGDFCTGGSGVLVGLSNSQTDVSYQLMRDGVNVLGEIVSGTGSLINFGNRTVAGTYSVMATNSSGCTKIMNGQATVNVNSLPIEYSINGGGSYCSEDPGVLIGLSNSQSGVSYQLKRNGFTSVGSPVIGDGLPITFGLQTIEDTYTVIASNSSGCFQLMTEQVDVNIDPLPTQYSVTGGGSYCTGDPGISIGLSYSQSGVSYQLIRDGENEGGSVLGTGLELDFGDFTIEGTYTIVATNSSNCTKTMSESAIITVNPTPTTFNVTGGGSYCVEELGLPVGLDGSEAGVNYSLVKDLEVLDDITGDGLAISFGNQTDGIYSIKASTASGCIKTMSGIANVKVEYLPAMYPVTGGGEICNGDIGVPVGVSSSEFGVTYQMLKDDEPYGETITGTGNPISFGDQSIEGTYKVLATNSTDCSILMTESATVTVNDLPIPYIISDGESYCIGDLGVMVSLNNSETGVSYQLVESADLAVGLPEIGNTGSAVYFGNQTEGDYTIIATNSTTGCLNTMDGNSIITSDPIPATFSIPVPGGASYCSGDVGIEVILNGSETGVSYQLIRDGQDVGSEVIGDGLLINYGYHTIEGIYTVEATNLEECSTTMGSVDVSINPLPILPSVVSDERCGAGIVNLEAYPDFESLDDQVKWYESDGTNTFNIGTTYSPDIQETTNYIVKSYNLITRCYSPEVPVTGKVNSIPTPFDITGGGLACDGVGVTVTLSNSETDFVYQLLRDGVDVDSEKPGTASAINFDNQAIAGEYKVMAINHSTGCFNEMSGSVDVYVSNTPDTPLRIYGNSFATVGSTEIYSTDPVIGEVMFHWSVPSDATITLGQNSNSITVEFGNTSGIISVSVENECGSNDPRTLDVTVYEIPDIPVVSSLDMQNGYTIVSIENPDPDYTYYWQKNETALLTDEPGTSNTYTEAGNYFVRAKMNDAPYDWSEPEAFTVYLKPIIVEPIFTYFAGTTRVWYSNYDAPDNPEGVELYWQTEPDGVELGSIMTHWEGLFPLNPDPEFPDAIGTEFTENESLFLRGKVKHQEIWSDPIEVDIEIRHVESISNTNIYIGGEDDLYPIQVTADCIWEVTDISESWVTVWPLTGNHNQEVTVKCDRNIGDYRTASFKIGEFTVNVNQFDASQTIALKNWTESKAFDEFGNVIAHGKSYFDLMGKPIQSQSKNISDNSVIISQTLYDAFGRAVISTLPAAVNKADLNYQLGFITNASNNTYSYENFDGDRLDDPDPVSSNIPASLGWYYSNNNTDEPYVPASEYPYTRVEYSKITGAARRSSMAGEHHKMGSNNSMSFTMPASVEELEWIYTDHSIDIEYQALIKSISVDAMGKKSATYTNNDGNVVATCIATGGVSKTVTQVISSDIGYVDVYLYNGAAGISPPAVTYTVTDLVSEQPYTSFSGLGEGFYRISVNESTDISFTFDIANTLYAVNVYDKVGRLKESYSPKAIEDAIGGITPILKTTYTYNILGWLMETTSPDQGTSQYVYRKDGSIRFSQNSQQVIDGTFSYSNYDDAGRIIEVGEYIENATILFSILTGDYDLPDVIENKQYVSNTLYDIPDAGFTETGYAQTFVAGSVSKTWNNNVETWYSYTYDGKVKWIAQDITDVGLVTIDYEYDFNGNVTRVIYQKDQGQEQFDHIYTYDADLRLLEVHTQDYQADGTANTQEPQAKYEYYAHGSLKRVEICNDETTGNPLQGIDYVYNINGWLKSINNPSLIAGNDPGGDDDDLFGMSLDYYSGDYERDNNITSLTTGTNLYDGNIKAQRWQTRTGEPTMDPGANNLWLSTYTYNNLNYLESANFGTYDYSANTKTDNPILSGLLYDANGNLTFLDRFDAAGNHFDDFEYNYDNVGKPNQLSTLVDYASDFNYNDIEKGEEDFVYDQLGQMTERSKYDENNNLIRSENYEYDVYGKVKSISYDGALKAEYLYDDKGFRIKKTDYVQNTETWYVRDASGNILSLYTRENSVDPLNITQTELPVYGSGRIGTMYKTDNQYEYELTDHLGNVRATFSKDASDNLQLNSYADYYPFGMKMAGRTSNAGAYRFGYQGQFAEDETEETGYNAFEARLWDSRIGRWTTFDPVGQYYSPYLGMGNNPINGVDPDGEFFGKLRSTVNSWFNKGSSVFETGNGNYYTQYADGSSKCFGGSGFNGTTLPFGEGTTFAGELTMTQFGNQAITENMKIVNLEGNLGKFLYNNPGVYKNAMQNSSSGEIKKTLYNARFNYQREDNSIQVLKGMATVTSTALGAAEIISVAALAPNLVNVAKDGWHLSRLGYHSIGKGVAKSSGNVAGKYLHINMYNKHVILNRTLLRQIKYWKYLK